MKKKIKRLIHWLMVKIINPLTFYSIWHKGKEPKFDSKEAYYPSDIF